MAGTRGPVPKRSTERRRRNKESAPDVVRLAGAAVVKAPRASRDWHPLARDWYRSLADSGQSAYFEPSDWQAARFAASTMTKVLNSEERVNANLVAVVWSMMNDLLTTEGQRRRVRLEIDRGGEEEQPASVSALADYRKSLAR